MSSMPSSYSLCGPEDLHTLQHLIWTADTSAQAPQAERILHMLDNMRPSGSPPTSLPAEECYVHIPDPVLAEDPSPPSPAPCAVTRGSLTGGANKVNYIFGESSDGSADDTDDEPIGSLASKPSSPHTPAYGPADPTYSPSPPASPPPSPPTWRDARDARNARLLILTGDPSIFDEATDVAATLGDLKFPAGSRRGQRDHLLSLTAGMISKARSVRDTGTSRTPARPRIGNYDKVAALSVLNALADSGYF
jgi:hypothetical protein